MIPDTVVGVLAFVAGIGPGYFFVRLVERREPRRESTPLEGAAEMLLVGGIATLLGVLVTLSLGEVTGLLDSSQIGKTPDQYFLDHPTRTLAAAALVLTASYGAVWRFACSLYSDGTGEIRPGDNAFYGAFQRDRPDDQGAFVTVGLRDGRALTGGLGTFPTDAKPPLHLRVNAPALPEEPIKMVQPSGKTISLPHEFIIVDLGDVLYVAGRYRPLASAPAK